MNFKIRPETETEGGGFCVDQLNIKTGDVVATIFGFATHEQAERFIAVFLADIWMKIHQIKSVS